MSTRNRPKLPPLNMGGLLRPLTPTPPYSQLSVPENRPPSPLPVPGNSTSKYHQSCVQRQKTTSPVRCSHRSVRTTSPLSPILSPSIQSGQPGYPKFNGTKVMQHSDGVTESQEYEVNTFLQNHPDWLENYVMDNVDLEHLERWIIRKTQRLKKIDATHKMVRKTSLSRWKFCVHADKRKMLEELTQSLQDKPNKAHVMYELGMCIASAVAADGFNLYLVSRDEQEVVYYPGGNSNATKTMEFRRPFGKGSILASYVADIRQYLRFSNPRNDLRFPEGVPFADQAYHMLCWPVIQADFVLIAVLELYRYESSSSFYEEDEEIVNSYLVWGSIAIHYAEMYYDMARQRQLNDFLLNVVKSIFQDMVSMDALILKIMNFAQNLVSADRASLFLLDTKTKEVFARIFDVGSDNTEGVQRAAREIRFPLGTGIAGQVALSGEILNISDVYSDHRFNRQVDQQTGYITRSILCMPIYIRGNIIGVVQMVNKQNGTFSKEDEDAFNTFSTYCGLALHHAKLYDKIRRSEQKYKVALEVLSYHSSCSEDEYHEIIGTGLIEIGTPGYENFYLNTLSLTGKDKIRVAIFMFQDLFGVLKFDTDSLIRFTMTVSKNYRRVPYHNWTHGFSVAQAMYAIIKAIGKVFKPLERLCLFVGALCHDLDHRGKNNKFMLDTESPLAAIYTTSTLEHHHFNQTVTILQQEQNNIFSKLSNDEYKQVLGNIKHCILATDLALFFPAKAELIPLLDQNNFSWSDPEHRLLLQAIAMTACDLCASTKPWDIQIQTVRVIFEEFYEQGDAERAAGKTPMPMMDRYKLDEQAPSQVGFLKGICIPCYEILYRLVPETEPLLSGCKSNLEAWEARAKAPKEVRIREACILLGVDPPADLDDSACDPGKETSPNKDDASSLD